MYSLKKRAAVFYQVLKHKAKLSVFRPDKTRSASFFKQLQQLPSKSIKSDPYLEIFICFRREIELQV